MTNMLMIDGLQYSNWSQEVFEQMRAGGLCAVHVTIAYHENCRETLHNMGAWNRLFVQYSDLIMPVHTAADIVAAYEQQRIGIIFGFQNLSLYNSISFQKTPLARQVPKAFAQASLAAYLFA